MSVHGKGLGSAMKKLTSLLAVAFLLAAAAWAENWKFRWHRNSDDSVFLDDDKYGQHLAMPADYYAANLAASKHYGEVNPASYEKFKTGEGFSISFDVAPRHILTDNEVVTWAEEASFPTNETWWFRDLLNLCYRNIEHRALVISGARAKYPEAFK